jgi:hypothetical protein
MPRRFARFFHVLNVGGRGWLFPAQCLVLLIALPIAARPSLSEEGRPELERHVPANLGGTVNVFLANRNGLVAVTDSRLSSGNAPAGNGVKLFEVDDHTICSVAGWYSTAGPTVDGIHFPAYEAIPKAINLLIAQPDLVSPWTLERKLFYVSSAVAFMLEVVDDMLVATGAPIDTESSEITMASVEGGVIRIARTDIVQRRVDGKVDYVLISRPTKIVGDGLIYSLAGRTAVGERILGNHLNDSGDAILTLLDEQVNRDGGKSLSIIDLQLIAKTIEHRTAANEPRIVGGPLQIATIENGKAHVIEQPIQDDLRGDPLPTVVARVVDVAFNHGYTGLMNRARAFLVMNSHFTDVMHQPLDRLFVFNTTFDHCGLFYGGSTNFFFDRSNTVRDSTLELGPNVDLDSPVIKKLREEFPQLTIISVQHPTDLNPSLRRRIGP